VRLFFIFLISFFFLTSFAFSQQKESNEFKCFDKNVVTAFDFLKTTRSFGNYEVEEEWSRFLSSDKIEKKLVELDGGRQYTFLVVAEPGVDATALEIRDLSGVQVEYVYKINEMDNNEINFFYTPLNDGIYQVCIESLILRKFIPARIWLFLKGDPDPDLSDEEEEEE
jgi:hypothetical protein